MQDERAPHLDADRDVHQRHGPASSSAARPPGIKFTRRAPPVDEARHPDHDERGAPHRLAHLDPGSGAALLKKNVVAGQVDELHSGCEHHSTLETPAGPEWPWTTM